MFSSKCAVCDSKKLKFFKEQEANELLSSLGLKTPLKQSLRSSFFLKYKIIEIIKKSLIAGDKFIPEMYLRLPRFTYNSSVPFSKKKERLQKLKKREDTQCIYQTELDKACFQQGMAYGDFKDVTRRAASDKIFGDKASNIVKNPKYDGYQRGLASMVYNFFNEKTSGSDIKNENNYTSRRITQTNY